MTSSRYDLKKDIQSGKVKKLKLIEVHNDVIRDNSYAEMLNVVREITRFDDEKFYLKTKRKPTQGRYELVNGAYERTAVVNGRYRDDWTECEAYYSVFSYDGKRLVKEDKFPAAVNVCDRLQRTVYEVIK